ncbi:MAG: carboxypeptidase-like regulatory domain-containing protein [Opitutaceae bacterium]|nr:carboxypeptidase-like regulatory domain-containing protein [Opitutaceae bacterium]
MTVTRLIPLRSLIRSVLTLALPILISAGVFAQAPAGGTIEGRVFDSARGEYLERVRVTVEGTQIETFTDESGQYRLTGVPAGTAQVRVFFTGLAPQSTPVNVVAGRVTQHDVTMSASAAPKPAADGTVKLDKFVVATSKEMDGAAIAINEQRFARTIVNVVAADEFGTVVDGTPGEVLKFLPGITMDYSAGEARTISMNGVPAANVPISVGGFDLASAAGNGVGRVTNLDQFTVNSISRIEVHHSPTPESTGSALAGSVNMVPRSAFERSRPIYSGSLFLTLKDGDRSFHKTPGPLNKSTRKITPGYNFSAVVPVNKRFGFTLSTNHVDQYSYENVATSTWRGNGQATNVAATALTGLPATTPDKPYLTDFALRDSTRGNRGDSAATTIDWKFSRNDTLSFSFTWNWIGVVHNNRTLSFFVNRVQPGAWSPTHTEGTRFVAGAPSSAQNGNTALPTSGGFGPIGGFGEIRVNGSAQDWYGTTWTPSLVWRHDGPIWKMDAGVGFSRASLHTRNVDKGFFGATQARRTGVRVSFADIFYLRPKTITVTGADGLPVDPYRLDNYALDSANAVVRDSVDLKRSARANVRRDLVIRNVPVSLKVGADIRSNERDLRATTDTYTFVGRDGFNSFVTGANAGPQFGDDNAGIVLDEEFSRRTGAYGFPRVQWISNDDYYGLYKSNPSYFTTNANNNYRAGVGASKYAREVISSAYFRTDAAFFNRRLQFVGGLRAEQTNVKGHGPLTDPTGNFQKDSAGNIVPRRDAAGNIVRNAAGQPLPALIVPTTDALGVSRLTYIDRGQRTNKEYLRLFPNLNMSYLLRENLQARFAYYQSVGRPNFDQYAGGLTLPDTSVPVTTNTVISVNNAGIKAWSAETYKVRLEYYFERVGALNIGAYQRDFKNFFGSVRLPATPEFLALYSLDPDEYGVYDVTTNHNLSTTVRMTGFEIDYKQALTFLPQWARGVQVFANASTNRAQGDGSANFAGFAPKTINWGASLTRPKYALRLNWNYRAPQRRGLIAANINNSIEPSTYNWGSKRLYTDVNADIHFRKNLTFFINMRNVANQTEDSKIYGPNTPDYAKFRQRVDYGSAWSIGLRGSL